MRKLLALAFLSLLALPAASPAGRKVPGEGTLSVRDATARMVITARGAVIGRFLSGSLTLTDPSPADGSEPIVRGAEQVRRLSATRAFYRGTNVRFRLIGGRFTLRTTGEGIYLTAVGRGRVRVRGDWGVFSLNGGEYRGLPAEWTAFTLRAPAGG